MTKEFLADTDVFKTSSGRLEKVMMSYDQTRRRDDVWKRRLIYDVLKTSNLQHLEDVRLKTSRGCLIYNVLKTSDLRHLENVQFKTSSRRL